MAGRPGGIYLPIIQVRKRLTNETVVRLAAAHQTEDERQASRA